MEGSGYKRGNHRGEASSVYTTTRDLFHLCEEFPPLLSHGEANAQGGHDGIRGQPCWQLTKNIGPLERREPPILVTMVAPTAAAGTGERPQN